MTSHEVRTTYVLLESIVIERVVQSYSNPELADGRHGGQTGVDVGLQRSHPLAHLGIASAVMGMNEQFRLRRLSMSVSIGHRKIETRQK